MKKYYVSTPIYYVNGSPHIGHVYTTVAADVLARFERRRGKEVFFSVGVDENSQKNVEAMAKAGDDNLQNYLDKMAQIWKTAWDDLGITYDRFIRTTEPCHHAAVERFWRAVLKSGDIYKGKYEGNYCTGCESFKTDSELADGRCPLHPKDELKAVSEENYFFKASNYRDELLALIDKHPEFVGPVARKNEIKNYIRDHFQDFSISRESKNMEAGIPVPDDPSQKIYVWFDALINYLTVVGYGTDESAFKQWWPADLHLVGKDIIKFHCALWPAMILSAAKNDPALRTEDGKAKLPKRIFAHGFFTIEGQKISKSIGNIIDPRDLVPTYGFDAIRYFLLREIPFGEDGDFSIDRLRERYVHDLSNTLGNLLNRAIAMSRKYFDEKIPAAISHSANYTFADEQGAKELAKNFDKNISGLSFDSALETIWNGIEGKYGLLQANKFIEDTQPFKLIKTDPDAVAVILYSLLEYCRIVAWLIEPIMPETAKKMITQLGQDFEIEQNRNREDLLSWGGCKPNTDLPQPEVLFPPL
ncbi:methionine--tRNA ligase [Patescibacteria group bacterium]|nr:methionine--tRNA ligase [Patescibacteria group bacterium]MBU1034193.1 methionine--tRNA ligase [Patescibacteria group bacterium]MBU1629815.1 methionine--tRNA ligase [Patescibacteria group bacterium]MBU1908237.1 methionine--tRNA ligase [Patescibacteria group bacterium]